MYRIGLVEDEAHLRDILTAYLEQEGWRVSAFPDGASAQEAVKDRYDLWVLDIMLPGGLDGYQLLRRIKADMPDTPVIFISARDADIDRIVGLELGSDDYVAKPFLPRELVIRVKKLLDRVYGSPRPDGVPNRKRQFMLPPYRIDEATRTVTDGEERRIELTSREFDLLLYFAGHAGQALGREQVLEAVWGSDYYGSDRVVDDLVRRLRRRLPELRLETLYGYGYRAIRG